MRAISSFSFDAGMSTRECFARIALRILVSMSAIGSVITQLQKRVLGVGFWVLGWRLLTNTQHPTPFSLPARLDDAGDLPLERQLAEADAAQLELAQVAAGPSAALATRVGARRKLLRPLRLRDQGFLRHVFLFSLRSKVLLAERHA